MCISEAGPGVLVLKPTISKGTSASVNTTEDSNEVIGALWDSSSLVVTSTYGRFACS